MTDTTLKQVAEFHMAFDQVIARVPYLDDEQRNALRINLLTEELNELAVALMQRDPVKVLDALTDLQYVLDGTYLSLGLAKYKHAAFAEVHRSNMSKLAANGDPVLREDGKILKGPDYSPPRLAEVMRSVDALERTLGKEGAPY